MKKSVHWPVAASVMATNVSWASVGMDAARRVAADHHIIGGGRVSCEFKAGRLR